MRWPRWLYRLDDPLDRWWGDDKAAHVFGGAFVMCKVLETSPVALAWFAVTVAVVCVELLELVRWESWQAKGAPQPWPEMCDRVSLKDIAWGLIGAWIATAL